MGLLGDVFDTAVDIAAAPVKLATKITDKVIDSDLTEVVDALKEGIKTFTIGVGTTKGCFKKWLYFQAAYLVFFASFRFR